MRLKWSNIPIPEAHLVGLISGIVVQFFFPVNLVPLPWLKNLIGWPFIVAGILISVWAVLAAEDMDIGSPTSLLIKGPYAYSRNPMYVGWTLMIFGIAFVMSNFWILLFLLIVVVYTHFFIILKEEGYLRQEFGQEYEQYQESVRRYL